MHRHSWKILLLIGSLIAVGTTLVSAKNQPEDINQLLVQGHFWYARGHNNLAINAWQKVLRAQPKNQEALAGLEEISEFDPESINYDQLKIARQLASEGKFAAALTAYKAAFNGKSPPTSFHAAEYFETLSGKKGQWDSAHIGLHQLFKRFPSNIEYQLSLARVESYQEDQRRSAIQHFESIQQLPDLTPAMSEKLETSWRQALLWLNATKKDIPSYERFLTTYPETTELAAVQQQLTKLKAPRKRNSADAFALLKKGKLKRAAAGFQTEIRRQPKNADNFEGLGITRLRQKRYAEAAKHLAKAIRLDKTKAQSLGAPLDDAKYWGTYQQARKARRNKQYGRSVELTELLMTQRPQQIEGFIFRAQTAADQADYSVAVRFFEQALKLEDDNRAAKAGLVSALVNLQNESANEDSTATALLDKYQLSRPAYQAEKKRIDATKLRHQAHQAKTPEDQLALLNKAMQRDPNNAWIRLDIANIYSKLEDTKKATSILQQLVESQPENLDARYAMALYRNANGQWQQAFQSLGKIPLSSRTEPQQKLALTLASRIQSNQAAKLLAAGDIAAARKIADKMAIDIDDDRFSQLNYADLLLALGDKTEALGVASKAMRDAPSKTADDIDLQLRYALILLKTEQHDDLKSVLAQLHTHKQVLRNEQLTALDQLELGAALQSANALLVAKKSAEAQVVITPLLHKHSQNLDLQLLQGAIYQQQHQHQKSLALFRNVLSDNPKNMDAIRGAYGSAMAMKEYQLASSITLAGLEQLPGQPELLTQLSKLDLIQGRKYAARLKIIQALESPAQETTQWRTEAEQSLQAIDEDRTTSLTLAAAIRERGNDDGLDKLEQRSIPLVFQRAIGNEKLLTLGLNYIDLDAGSLRLQDSNRYGSLELASNNSNISQVTGSSNGIAPNVKIDSDIWSVDIGSTPTDFNISNLVGGVSWRFPAYDYSLEVSASRRAVKESLLSYAGAFDPQSNQLWGGVTRSGAQINYSTAYKNSLFYTQADTYRLEGKRVLDNTELGLSGGLSWPILVTDEQKASLGIHLSVRDFKENLGFYSLGHGGYFSPSNFISLSIPFEFQKQLGNLAYRINMSVGIQQFNQAATDVFPNNPELQTQLVTLAATDNALISRHARAETSNGVYTLGGEVGYSLDKRLIIGGWTSLNNTNNFDEMAGGMFLRYSWDSLSQLQLLPKKSFVYSEVW
ncbi:MAG TPA: hypothetical protein DD827_09670 [Gammaproteobacteria bacterium]|nr:hypothetical protein [Gammaproteobacteria bacterium]